jgi:hypothetical protein
MAEDLEEEEIGFIDSFKEVRRDFENHFSIAPFDFPMDRYTVEGQWPGSYKSYNVECSWDAWLNAYKKYVLKEF